MCANELPPLEWAKRENFPYPQSHTHSAYIVWCWRSGTWHWLLVFDKSASSCRVILLHSYLYIVTCVFLRCLPFLLSSARLPHSWYEISPLSSSMTQSLSSAAIPLSDEESQHSLFRQLAEFSWQIVSLTKCVGKGWWEMVFWYFDWLLFLTTFVFQTGTHHLVLQLDMNIAIYI